MLCHCSFKISRVPQAFILELWPFGADGIKPLLKARPPKYGGFIAVKHSQWRDGFHPPATKLLPGKSVSRGLVVRLDNKIVLSNILESSTLDSVVDLKLFFPSKPVTNKAEVTALEKCFLEFDESSALKAWGGYWIHTHDACKTYITLPLRIGLVDQFFSIVLAASNARLEKGEFSVLCKRLHSLAESQCLLLSWFKDSVRYRVESTDVHDCEQTDKLLSGNWLKLSL